jgi:hypothetical protein
MEVGELPILGQAKVLMHYFQFLRQDSDQHLDVMQIHQ